METPLLSRFRGAMEPVYGPLPTSNAEARSWTPPPKAGGWRGRYLWTDAFGVINFITLYKESNDETYLSCAKNLVQAVHDINGRTRDGKSRLPGASDLNPLEGGLRIGKTDESGSDGDGQYFHYNSLWMFALNRLSIASKVPEYNDRAIQFAKAIHPHFFIDKDTSSPRMVWKIAMDMSRPLVWGEGNLDPIDGYVTMKILGGTAHSRDVLSMEIKSFKRVMERKGKHFVSSDMLDLGMSLWTSHWFADQEAWAADLQAQCLDQLKQLLRGGQHSLGDMRYRLAFRDFGACLGIQCVGAAVDNTIQDGATELLKHWEKHIKQTPEDLRPITQVMYAAALIPGAFKKGYLGPESTL